MSSTASSKLPYSAVYALTVCWKDSAQEQFKQQLKGLAKELRAYNFEVESFEIESKRPQQSLARRLNSFLQHDKADTLLILYYGGHGLNNKDKSCIWLRDDPATVEIEKTPKVNWNALQSLFIDDCDGHVLFLLDCCFGGASVLSTDGSSTVEAIVATGFESVAPLRGKDSFTTFLIAALKESRNEASPVFAGRLCTRITAKLNQTQRLTERDGARRVTPKHITFSNKPGSIVIGPLAAPTTSQELTPPPDVQSSLPKIEPISQPQSISEPDVVQKKDTTPGPTPLPGPPPNVQSDTSLTLGQLLASSSPEGLRFQRTVFNMKSNTPPGGQQGRLTSFPSRARSYVPSFPQIATQNPPQSRNYSYTSIGPSEIRILKLLPYAPDPRITTEDRIICSFERQQFMKTGQGSSTPHDYMAVSGRWDSPYEDGSISVIEGASVYTLHVPLSLQRALRQIRDPVKETYLWVDLICIDPNSNDEQDVQAPLIPDIFHNASQVIIWLGMGDDTSNVAIDFIPRLLDLRQVDTLVKHEETPRQWQALVNLLRRPYFSRRWAFLEIILARRATIFCGTQRIEWTDFCDAVVLLGSRYEEVQVLLKQAATSAKFKPMALIRRATFGSNANHAADIALVDLRALAAYSVVEASRQLFRREGDGSIITKCKLETLVSMLPAMQSGHPSAVIFALLPVASDEQQWLQASHGVDGDSPVEVYQQFVRHCVESSRSLDIICRPWAPQNEKLKERDNTRNRGVQSAPPPVLRRRTTYGTLPKGEQLPSWIRQVQDLPFGDGARTGRRNGDILVGYPDRPIYNAAKGSSATPIFGQPSPSGEVTLDGSMTVSGFVISPVIKPENRASGGIIQKEWIELGGWQLGDHTVEDSLWRTLVADRGPGGTPTPLWYNQACRYWLELYEGEDITGEMIQDEQHPSMALEYIQRVRAVIWNRTLFSVVDHTGKPLLGLGPPDTRNQDLVCVLHGCAVPVVLRKQDGYWSFIGECFVYSLMEGEAMRISEFTAGSQEFLLR